MCRRRRQLPVRCTPPFLPAVTFVTYCYVLLLLAVLLRCSFECTRTTFWGPTCGRPSALLLLSGVLHPARQVHAPAFPSLCLHMLIEASCFRGIRQYRRNRLVQHCSGRTHGLAAGCGASVSLPRCCVRAHSHLVWVRRPTRAADTWQPGCCSTCVCALQGCSHPDCLAPAFERCAM